MTGVDRTVSFISTSVSPDPHTDLGLLLTAPMQEPTVMYRKGAGKLVLHV